MELNVIVGPCTRADLERAMELVQSLLDNEMPLLGAAVAGRFSLADLEVPVAASREATLPILAFAVLGFCLGFVIAAAIYF